MSKPVGVIGAGSFGTAIAKILAENNEVLLFSRKDAIVNSINTNHIIGSIKLAENIIGTTSLEKIASFCDVIFPIIPSEHFRKMCKTLSPYIKPYHLIIHGTKGLDVTDYDLTKDQHPLHRSKVHTMSEIIVQETSTYRVGCLSGPNLAKEIHEGKPTATVIASSFDEVINVGKKVLDTKLFTVFGTNDILGAEMAGAFKNAIAIGSGILGGLDLGKNIQSILITRGVREMIFLAKAMGGDIKTFFGTAGIGDLVATATSSDSRNYTFGTRIGKGEKTSDIKKDMKELAEGVRTVKVMKCLADHYGLRLPIIKMIHSVIFEDFPADRAVRYLMKYPYGVDVDFM